MSNFDVQVMTIANSAETGCGVPDASNSSGFSPNFSTADVSSPEQHPWSPRIGASHLSKGVNGVWYMRLAIPEAIRARYPELPKELRRSTKASVKRGAFAKAREMCLDFLIKYSSGTPMRTLDDETPVQSFALFYKDGRVRIQHSPSANNETLYLLSRCYELMMSQVVGR